MHFRAYLHDVSRYWRFNAQKHETNRQNTGGAFFVVPANKLLGDMSLDEISAPITCNISVYFLTETQLG